MKFCETVGCSNEAIYFDPTKNKLCSNCCSLAVNDGEFKWRELKRIEEEENDQTRK